MSDQRTVGELWWRVNRELHERFRHTFKDLDIPPMTLMMMRQIELEPGVTVSELARRSSTVKSHVSKTVDQLAVQGLVEKRPDPQDQRLLRVYPTPAATAFKKQIEARAMAHWAEITADIPEADLAEVERGLRILLGALAKASSKVEKE